MMKFTCPRRRESGMHLNNSVFKLSGSDLDHWDSQNTCSYCGSLNQITFMEHLEAGDVKLGPTDKNYKVYVEGIPDPDAGKPTIYSSANYEQTEAGWVKVTPENIDSLPLDKWQRENYNDGKHWVKVEPRRATIFSKFYFQHLSEEQRGRFIELYNDKRLNIGYPGYFYNLPFFCKLSN